MRKGWGHKPPIRETKMKQRNFRTFSKIDQVRTVEEGYMGYIVETGEYFISELKDPKANKQECIEWAQANGGQGAKAS